MIWMISLLNMSTEKNRMSRIMKFKKILIIYRKEILDLLRDRRTVFASFVLPLVLYPVIMIGFTSLVSRQETKLEQGIVYVSVTDHSNSEISRRLVTDIESIDDLEIKTTRDSSITLVKNNYLQASIAITDSINTSGYLVMLVKISYNEANERSTEAYNRIIQRLQDWESELIGERLQELKIEKDILNIVEIRDDNVAPPEKMLGFIFGKILPYLLIVLIMSGASVIASDLVAGEKERGTLETVLVSAAHRIEIIIGKYLTIITFSIVTVLLNLFSMYISIRHIFGQSGVETSDLQLPLSSFALVLIAILPFITLISAILISISTYARNIKEAQSYQMPLIFGGMMLAMVSMLPGVELTVGFALIPIINFSLLFKEIMISGFNTVHFLLVIISTVIFNIIAIRISLKLFNNETILFRTAEEKSLKFWGKGRQDVLNPRFAVFFYLVLILLLYYIGGSWQFANLYQGIAKTQLLLILLPVILLLKISKKNIPESLGLRSTKSFNFLLVLLMSLPILIIAAIIGQLTNLLYPLSESYLEGMKNLVSAENRSLWQILFIIALLPGICEEILFRGYFLKAFKQNRVWFSIVISGVLFGISHLDPFRLIPVSLLGIYLGFLAYFSRSLFLPIFAHFLNNAIAVVISNYGDKIPVINSLLIEDGFLLWIAVPAVITLSALFFIFTKYNIGKE